MRLFVALAFSDETRKGLASAIDQLRCSDPKPRWVSPANLHVTLKFIGHVPTETVSVIEQSLSAIAAPQLMVEFRALGFFPNDRRPSVLWVGMEAPPELGALAVRIDQALAPRGIARETRPFTPHLTLARFKETRLSPSLRAKIEEWKTRSFGKETFIEFQLMESRLRTTGAEYTTVRSFPLASRGI